MGKAIRIKAFTITILLLITTAVMLFGFSFVSTAFAESPTVTLIPNGGTIEDLDLTEDGTVLFESNEEESVLPTPTKQGYEFLGWTKSESDDDNDYITILSENFSSEEYSTLFAKYALKAPEIILEPTDYSGIYGENEHHILSVSATHELDCELSIQWYKDSVLLEGKTESELKASEVKHSGIYYATVSITVDGETATATSRNAFVRIQKAKPTAVPQIILEGVYSPEKTLSDYPLQENYHWLDEGIIPTPSVRRYSAIFNIDSDNYYDYPCTVVLIISKAEQEIFVDDLTKEYDGEPLSIVATTSGNSILEYSENNSLTDVGREIVKITAPETDLYMEKSVTAVLEVLPQTIEIEWTNLEFVYNKNEQIPCAVAVDKKGLSVELNVYANGVDAGVHYATAESISKNYVISNPSVEYTILKADYNSDLIVFEDKEFVFDGNAHSLDITYLPEWISVSYDKTATEVGFYTITASFVVNNKNYNDIEPKTAKLTILQNSFKGEWYEILCPEGVAPDVVLSLELIDNLDGLSENHNGKLKYILGFRVVSTDGTTYKKPMTVKFNYESVGIDNLVLSVDKDLNEQIITYAYENGKVIISLSGTEENIVFAERTQGIAWIIVLVVGICIAVSVGVYLILNKKSNVKTVDGEPNQN